MFMCGGIQRAEGHFGFDFVTHRGDPLPANTDMGFTVTLPEGPVNNNRDRMDRVEALSGWNFNDILRGDDRQTLGVEDFERDLTGHELDAAGIARISGLAAILPAGATSFTGGNIILGGDGADIIEGRGGDDIIDGDRWLDAELQVGTTRYPGVNNVYVPGTSNVCTTACAPTLRLLAAQGTINPGAISIVRSIKTQAPGTFVDTAVFSGLLAEYDIVLNANGSVTVTHIDPDDPTVVGIDGIDTLWNIERLTFADQSVELGVLFNTAATGTVNISGTLTEGQVLTALQAVTDVDGILAGTVFTFTWEAEVSPDEWSQVGVGNTFTPGDAEVGLRLRVIVTFNDRFGVPEQVVGDPFGPIANVNDAPVNAAGDPRSGSGRQLAAVGRRQPDR